MQKGGFKGGKLDASTINYSDECSVAMKADVTAYQRVVQSAV